MYFCIQNKHLHFETNSMNALEKLLWKEQEGGMSELKAYLALRPLFPYYSLDYIPKEIVCKNNFLKDNNLSLTMLSKSTWRVTERLAY